MSGHNDIFTVQWKAHLMGPSEESVFGGHRGRVWHKKDSKTEV